MVAPAGDRAARGPSGPRTGAGVARRPTGPHSGAVRYVVGIPFLVLVVALAWGALTGRVRAQGCCAVADPARDLRMRDAVRPTDG